MRRTRRTAAVGLSVATTLVAALIVPHASATAAPAAAPSGPAAQARSQSDELPNPLEDKRRALKQEALTQVLNGKATPQKRGASTVVKVGSTPSVTSAAGTSKVAAKDQYVELSREATDRVFVILTEFGDERDARFPDKDLEPSIPGPTTFLGPLHNQIPEPDRALDNSTNWEPDYSQAHFQNLYFGRGDGAGSGGQTESVKQYFSKQSSGRYSIDGTVTDWVKVKYNEARYGRSSDNPATNGDDPNVCSGHVCNNTWDLVKDAANQWYDDQIASGRSQAEVVRELKTFDQWDRYDIDGDGNFNEPDGYLDHFQILHAGGDEADGDPIQGEDAIWSHRWYAYGTDAGVTGPPQGRQGGTQIGNSGIWIGDYTAQPENGGMSVIAHEYTHDLGLPDLYDTNGGSNSVEFWSLMAQSRLSGQKDQAIGSRAGDLGAWEKLTLGWLDYETVLPAQNRRIELGPHEYNSAKAQAAVVVLPKKELTTDLVAPFAGTKSWWSGAQDSYTATMARSVAVPAGSPDLTFQANYNIEADYDYAYVEVDNGSGWVSLPGTGTDPAANNGLTGDSGGAWSKRTYSLAAYAGTTVQLRIRYTSDGGVQGNDPSLPAGIFVDDIAVGSFTDGAETGANGWTLSNFAAVGDSVTQQYDNYYIASNRTYNSFDTYLKYGPYNFGFLPSKPDFVEHFPYQNGLLISYWDTSQSDNNTSVHPGEGLILPVDANPRAIPMMGGGYWRTRVAGYDSTFGLEKSDSITLHVAGAANYIRGQAAVPVFRDDKSYYDAATPAASVKVPDTGTTIRVLTQDGTSMGIKVSQR